MTADAMRKILKLQHPDQSGGDFVMTSSQQYGADTGEQPNLVDRMDSALQKCVARLVGESDCREAIVQMLMLGHEVLSPLGLIASGFIAHDPSTQTLRCRILVRHGEEIKLTGTVLDHDWPVNHPSMVVPWRRIQDENFVWGLTSDETVLVPEVRAFHEADGTRAVAYQALLRGGKAIGWIGYSFKSEARPDLRQIRLIQTLATHVSLAVEFERLSEVARESAVLREQEQSAKRRADEMARASKALQKTIDEVSKLQSLESFIPHALRIAAEAFGVSAAGYFEHPDDTIFLRYWLLDNKIFGPDELPGLDSSRYSLLGRMAAGFTVPTDHLGVHFRQRTKPSIIHHLTATASPELHSFAVSLGWAWELNVPLMVNGLADGAITLFRPQEMPFTEAEFSLAESLGKQIALAMQTSRIAEHEKEALILREREKAAEQRATDLLRSNQALQESIDALGLINDLNDLLPAVLRIVGRTFGALSCAYYEHFEGDLVFLRYWSYEGKILNPEDLLSIDPQRFGLVKRLAAGFNVPDDYLGSPVRARTRAVIVDHQAGTSVPEFDAFAMDVGWGMELNVPLVVNGSADGAICIYRPADAAFTQKEIELAETLAKQLAVAMTTGRIALREREAAVAREQMQAERVRADDAMVTNRLLEGMVAASRLLLNSADFQSNIRQWLGILAEAADADHAILGRFAPQEDPANTSLFMVDWAKPGLEARDGFLVPATRQFLEWTERLKQGKIILAHYHELQEESSRRFWQQTDCASKILMPIVVDQLSVAWLAFNWRTHRDLKPAYGALLQNAAAGAAAAIRRDNAVKALLAERELASRQQAEELARANSVLRRGTDQLAGSGGIEKFLASSLAEASNVSGANAAALFVLTGNATEMVLRCHHPNRPNNALERLALKFKKVSFEDERNHFSDMLCREFTTVDLRDALLHRQFPEAAAYHEMEGHELGWHLTLRVGGRAIGFLALAFRHPVLPTDSVRETLNALTQQIALALELTRLGEDAKQLAITQEKERAAEERLAQFASANAILSQSLDAVSGSTDLEQMPGVLLTSLITHFGAISGSLWRYHPEDGAVSLQLEYAEGKLLPRKMSGFAHKERHFFTPEHSPSYEKHLSLIAGEMLVLDVQTSEVFLLNEREHLLNQGVQTLLVLPLSAAKHHLGRMALGFADKVVFTNEESSLARTLSNQIALALEMVRLAKEVEASAIGREREKAAGERVAELAKTNVALRNSISRLVERPDLKCFIEQMLKDTAAEVGAISNLLFKLEEVSQLLTPYAFVYEGRAVDIAEDPRFIVFREPLNGGESCSSDLLSKSAAELWIDFQKEQQHIPAEILSFHKSLGHKAAFVLPLIAGERVIALMALCFADVADIRCERLELLRALTQQMTLALELSSLSQTAQSAAVLEERNRLAREIHDTIAQGLTGVISQLEVVEEAMPMDAQQAMNRVGKAKALAKASLIEARRSVWALHPPELEGRSLVEALEQLAAKSASDRGLEIHFQKRGDEFSIPAESELDLYRIAHEAVRNALKHSEASRIHLIVVFEAGQFCIRVIDNGCGIAQSQAGQVGASFGLISMRERAERLGGKFSVTSAPDEGTVVEVCVPRKSIGNRKQL